VESMTQEMRQKLMMEIGGLAKQLSTPEGIANPYPIYEGLKRYGSHLKLGDQHFVFGYDDCKKILSDDRFRSPDAQVRDKWMPGWQSEASWRSICTTMLFKNEPDHSRVRAFVSAWFTPKSVEKLRGHVQRAVDHGIAVLRDLSREGRPVDSIEHFVDWVPLNVMCEMLGVPEADRKTVLPLIMPFTAAFSATVDKSQLTAANACIEKLDRYFRDLTAIKRANPADDLMSHLIQKFDAEHEVDEEELIGTFLVLVIGGFAAPADMLGNLVALVAEHPDWAGKMRADATLIPAFVEECIRFDPPAQLLNRVAVQDVNDFPVPIAAGTKVNLAIAAANRDPAHFEDALTFDPSRKIQQHLSFGMGAHYCLGFILARMQCQAVVAGLISSFSAIDVVGPKVYRPQLLERGYQRLMLNLTSA